MYRVTLLCIVFVALADGAKTTTVSVLNNTLEHNKCYNNSGNDCGDGMLFPLWRPIKNIGTGDRVGRAIVYFLAICYMFLGISIVSDRFMAAIEVITSTEREVVVRRPDGETVKFTVKIWNETVSNLTLMALGSSAPEIMLSVIEVSVRTPLTF
jgi:solute carrier family 8 (sodium/calcium exchanger)